MGQCLYDESTHSGHGICMISTRFPCIGQGLSIALLGIRIYSLQVLFFRVMYIPNVVTT